jgi:hypothetical protein
MEKTESEKYWEELDKALEAKRNHPCVICDIPIETECGEYKKCILIQLMKKKMTS